MALVIGAAVLQASYDWDSTRRWLGGSLPLRAAESIDAMYPGFRAAVDWIHARGLQRVRTLPYDSDAFRYQRLMEMLFPIQVEPTDPAALRAGDIVVIGAPVQLPMATDELLGTPQLRIVEVR